MIALKLYEDNRIHSASTVPPNGNYDGIPIVDSIPEGNLPDYLYINGEFVYDPIPKEEPTEPDVPVVPEDAVSVWDELDAAYQEGVDSV